MDSRIAYSRVECNIEKLLYSNLHGELGNKYKKVEYWAIRTDIDCLFLAELNICNQQYKGMFVNEFGI